MLLLELVSLGGLRESRCEPALALLGAIVCGLAWMGYGERVANKIAWSSGLPNNGESPEKLYKQYSEERKQLNATKADFWENEEFGWRETRHESMEVRDTSREIVGNSFLFG